MKTPDALLAHQPGEASVPLIQNPEVAGLGEAALVCVYPERVNGEYTGRWHEQYTVELDGHKHSVLVTNPTAYYSQTDTYFFAGFGQTTDERGGPGFTLHTELAARMPHIRMLSIASTGIGRVGDRVHHATRELATMDAMAEQRYRLMSALSGDRQKQILGLSMGTVIAARLLELDLNSGQKLGITGVVEYVPAVVTPDRVAQDMKKAFPRHIVVDSGRELTDRRNLLDPRNLLSNLRVLGRSGLTLADLPALGVMAGSLYLGTELATVKNDAQNYRMAIVGGEKDPLTQPLMWGQEEAENPHNVSLKIIPKRGHGMALDSVGAAVQVERNFRRINPAA